MKRSSQGGDSPVSKYKYFEENETDSEEDIPLNLQLISQSTPSQNLVIDEKLFLSQPSSINSHECISSLVLPSPSSNSIVTDIKDDVNLPDEPEFNFEELEQSSFEESQPIPKVSNSLHDLINVAGLKEAATTILDNEELKQEILKQIFAESHESLKTSLKRSRLTASKKDRNYLLSLTPEGLCQEFQENSFPAFRLLVHGLLGVSNQADVFDSQFLQNNVCLLYSTISKIINRTATGYALLLTTAARDGGLREDSIKLFSILVHPRTSQKYDKEVLAVGWDVNLNEHLKTEKKHFEKQRETEDKIEKLYTEAVSMEAIEEATNDLEILLDSAPPQLQLVWDNLNLRTKHRYERTGDDYSDSNLDWMGSLWIQDRIDCNHMDGREGVTIKDVENLNIHDMVPTDKEKDYVFKSLVHHYSHRLVVRHPLVFKSLASCVKQSKPHQFQHAMDRKSEEFTGELFTNSESKIEDLIKMMTEVQKKVHTYTDNSGVVHCPEKKILSGDNKTEKNMHYGILRLTM